MTNTKEVEYKYTTDDMKKLQALPLDAKVLLSKARIREFYGVMRGKVYVAFSGGKDSTVLLHLVRSIYSDVPAVFLNTGLEFPEVVEFVKNTENTVIVTPDKSFKRIIDEHGYPIISKEVARAVEDYRNGLETVKKKFTPEYSTKYGYYKYRRFLDSPFKISAKCCYYMKKKPIKQFEKKSGLRPYLGILASESRMRMENWRRHGCLMQTTGHERAYPIAFWTDEDVWAYIKQNTIPYSKIYDMGYKRTGCMFCMFGILSEKSPNRFQRMQRTHPKQYEYCMKESGLNLIPVLEFLDVEYKNDNKTLEEYTEKE